MADLPLAQASGFSHVDENPLADMLVAAMKAADAHPAVQTLRSWSADQLRLRAGDHVVDVGCGPGTAAIALFDLVGPGGRVTGIDSSAKMIAAAQKDVPSGLLVEFRTGDAYDLDIADGSIDAYRSERTYQHLADPAKALGEAVRVVRPGGRVAVIDTDWGTLAVDHPDRELTLRLSGSGQQANRLAGRRLFGQFQRAGLEDVSVRAESIVATSWDPASAPGVPGILPFRMVVDRAQESGICGEQESRDWLEVLEREAIEGRFFLSLTMMAVVGSKPE